MNANNKQVKSKKRVVDHGEVFTSEREVNAMLDLVKHETERIESRFFEPACGDGNFLHEILRRKFKIVKDRYSRNLDDFDKYMIVAVSSVYGVELLEDNAIECRKRLYNFFLEEYQAVQKTKPDTDIEISVKFLLDRNILCGDALTLLSSNGEPIIFSEWSLITGGYLKRRDFKLAEMLSFTPATQKEIKITSNASYDNELLADVVENNLVIRVYKEYPLINYRRIYEHS